MTLCLIPINLLQQTVRKHIIKISFAQLMSMGYICPDHRTIFRYVIFIRLLDIVGDRGLRRKCLRFILTSCDFVDVLIESELYGDRTKIVALSHFK